MKGEGLKGKRQFIFKMGLRKMLVLWRRGTMVREEKSRIVFKKGIQRGGA